MTTPTLLDITYVALALLLLTIIFDDLHGHYKDYRIKRAKKALRKR
jgi:hypothetical protein